MSFEQFHPAVRDWFNCTFDAPTSVQLDGWRAIARGADTLIAAPTGSGKTLAAFLAAIDDLTWQAVDGTLGDGVQVVYISPLRALSNDIERNLQAPLNGIMERLHADGVSAEIRAGLRTGDTTKSQRAKMTRKPPQILVSTPESLYILLGSEGGRNMLRTARTVIVDEIHAVAPNRRGAHLSLTLERLDQLVSGNLVRVGLSATQKPMELVANYLTGAARKAPQRVDVGHAQEIDLAVEVTGSPLSAVMSAEHMDEVYDRLAELVEKHQTTLIFTNTRREAERVTGNLERLLGEGTVASHHGALSRDRRFAAEQALKAGQLKAIVATASLELGIDVGVVDLVCQIGSVKAIGTLLQRVGRSGHHVGGTPKGRVFPLTLDELVEAAALVDSVRREELDRLYVEDAPVDILAQHIVAAVGNEDWDEQELFELIRRSYSYRELPREAYESVLAMLGDGFSTRRGRRGAHVHWDQVNGKVRGRRAARLTALTSGGAIPDRADYRVVLDHDETFVGTLDEDFAIESMPGDIFQLGNTSWQIERIDSRRGQVRVHDARGKPPSIPFWFGEAPARTTELSEAVSRLRDEVDRRIESGDEDVDTSAAVRWAMVEVGLDPASAEQVVNYLATSREALGVMPTREQIVVERFFDEAGNTHLVVHSPFGSRLNRAWGLALRKRFCRSFNFELQAAANEDAIILSMGPTHSFPLQDVYDFLSSTTVRRVLIQALLDAPMFGTRWRWNLNRSLAVPRFRGGKKVAPPLQRMQAEDLLAVVFPDQLACLENIAGDREIPDHPLVQQTIRDCLEEAMDIDGLEALLKRIEDGEVATIARDLREPSPLAHQIINARPYAFLDDAPLEERRTMAIQTRGLLDPNTVGDLAALDPTAIDRVRSELDIDVRDADELHDALVCRGYLTSEEVREHGLDGLADELRATARAGMLDRGLWISAERLREFEAVFEGAAQQSGLRAPRRVADTSYDAHQALTEILRSRLEFYSPTVAQTFIEDLGLDAVTIESTLLGLEASGFAFRGQYDVRVDQEQWCERGLLARIHRYTLSKLRREIEPVTPADFMRFLFHWQRVAPGEQATGPDGVAAVLEQLSGVHVAAAAWETEVLPLRVSHYDPSWLDMACLSGRFVWGRLRSGQGKAPVRTSPICIPSRADAHLWVERDSEEPKLSSTGQRVVEVLESEGASFFDDLAASSRLLGTQAEATLAELVAAGRVTSDSFAGLRALLVPQNKRPKVRRHGTRLGGGYSIDSAGRWSLLRQESREQAAWNDEEVRAVALRLLARWGVVFRVIARRETSIGWRKLLAVYRSMEARGEIRGGRFVTKVGGEQYALPEAVATMRRVRRAAPDGSLIAISACDPLNLTGVLVGNSRVAAQLQNRIVFRDGVPIAALEGREVRYLEQVGDLDVERILVRKPPTPRIRSYAQS